MKDIGLYLGPAAAGLTGFLLYQWGWQPGACWTGAVTVLCAVWWILEPIPIPVTSMIPLTLFTMTGVLTPGEVGESYGSPLVLLLMGGFILSTAMAKSGAHRRIALNMVSLFGHRGPKGVVFGFMAASAVLSMWISNTATTLMLLPIVLAVLEQTDDKRFGLAMLLGIAYAASVGGIGTPIGTPPNVIFMRIYAEATGSELSFLDWMKLGLPVVIVFVPIIGLWLTRNLETTGQLELPEVGRWRTEEVRTLGVFALTALAWVTRKEPFGGWSTLLGLEAANDASVALAAVVVMFLVPNGHGQRLLDWKTAEKIPWGILILFGGGIAIAKAFVNSGLSAALGELLAGFTAMPLVVLIALICLSVTFLTEVTSNTATTVLLMPILAAAAVSAGLEPMLLMVPAAMSASCAFMLPVATAPNAIVFGTGRFTVRTMVREGFALNLIGMTVITSVCYVLLAR